MENKKEMTIPNVSAATDAEQSLSKCTDNSIVNQDTDFKGYEQSFEEMQREILRQLDPSYLITVSMTTLYETVVDVQITHVCRSYCFRCSVQRRQAICISQRNVKRSMADWKNR